MDLRHNASMLLLIVAIGLGAFTLFSVRRVSDRVQKFEPLTMEDIQTAVRREVSSMLEETVTTQSGRTIVVRTTQREGEDWSDTLIRHNKNVKETKAL